LVTDPASLLSTAGHAQERNEHGFDKSGGIGIIGTNRPRCRGECVARAGPPGLAARWPVLIHPVDTMSDVEPDDAITVVHHHRRRRRPGRRTKVVAVLAVALAGGGMWWHGAVTADPKLSFDGGGNVFRTAEAGDMTGITRDENSLGADVNVAYQAGAPLHAFFGLYNDGPRTVTVEALPRQGVYYWAFDGAALSTNPKTASSAGTTRRSARSGSTGARSATSASTSIPPPATRPASSPARRASCPSRSATAPSA
jgi:hypothetical protein